jgi:hypothetical protein
VVVVHVELDPQAENDLEGFSRAARTKLRKLIREVTEGKRYPREAPYGRAPWQILELAGYIAVCRPLSQVELRRLDPGIARGYWVIRVFDKADLPQR